MVKYIMGDYYQTPAKVIVNTVNTVGVMGKGLALKFKQLYPEMFRQYQYYCDSGLLTVGKLWLYKTDNKWILNFPTKKDWRDPSKIEYITAGLQKFCDTYQQQEITSIAFPELGCGNGGLDWKTVKPIMEHYLNNLPIDIYIYESNTKHKREYESIEETKKWIDQYPGDISFKEFSNDIKTVNPQMPYNDETFQSGLQEFWNCFKNNRIMPQENVFFHSDEQFLMVFDACQKINYISVCSVMKEHHYVPALQLLPSSGSVPLIQENKAI